VVFHLVENIGVASLAGLVLLRCGLFRHIFSPSHRALRHHRRGLSMPASSRIGQSRR
jgi:hypothetical protein